MEPLICPDVSVRNCHYSLCNSPKKCSSHLLCGGNLKSRLIKCSYCKHFQQHVKHLPNNCTKFGCFISFMMAASSRKSFRAMVSSCKTQTSMKHHIPDPLQELTPGHGTNLPWISAPRHFLQRTSLPIQHISKCSPPSMLATHFRLVNINQKRL